MNKDYLRLAGIGLILLGLLLVAGAVGIFLSPNSYEAVVRLKLEKDLTEFSSFGSGGSEGFDPYWIQDQFETLQSKSILYRVITNLDLTRKWAEKLKAPEPLRIKEAYAQLKKQIDLRQTRTSLIAVKVGSTDPIEAAAIANEIAEVYLRARVEARHAVKQRGIGVLKAELEKRNQDLTNKLAEIAALNASSGTNGSEDRVVENLNYIREKLRDRIRLEEDEVSAGPRTSLVEIVDRAEPPLRPRHDRRALAIATLFAGLGAIALGRRLLRKAQAIAAPIRGADVATVRGV